MTHPFRKKGLRRGEEGDGWGGGLPLSYVHFSQISFCTYPPLSYTPLSYVHIIPKSILSIHPPIIVHPLRLIRPRPSKLNLK